MDQLAFTQSYKQQLVWDEDAVTALRALFEQGKTASEMGREFGISRSAVLGKLHRLGLRRGRDVARPDAKRPRKARGPYKRVPWAVPAARPRRIDPETIVCQPVPFLDLPFQGACKFVVSGEKPADYLFCANATMEERPYCAAHCRVAYGPSQARATERAA
jgi:GcrA cell cycle regulator